MCHKLEQLTDTYRRIEERAQCVTAQVEHAKSVEATDKWLDVRMADGYHISAYCIQSVKRRN